MRAGAGKWWGVPVRDGYGQKKFVFSAPLKIMLSLVLNLHPQSNEEMVVALQKMFIFVFFARM